jgi:hypothetical protein
LIAFLRPYKPKRYKVEMKPLPFIFLCFKIGLG